MGEKLDGKWKARAVQLKQEAYALYLCSRHPKTPWHARLFALFIVGYAMSPIDLIPDFIPVIGYVDDLVLVPLGLALLMKMVPEEVIEECRSKARALPAGRPLGWLGAVIIIFVWISALCVAYYLVKTMF